MAETAYDRLRMNDRGELRHHYGEHVHLSADPLALTWLARLCSPDCQQPEVNRIVTLLYRGLVRAVINGEFPRKKLRTATRMADLTDKGHYQGQVIDPDVHVTTVDVARAGILPSMVCFEALCEILTPGCVRQDHVMMNRITNDRDEVTGAGLHAAKIAGPIDGRFMLIPDPMGATGSSLVQAIDFYRDEVGGSPRHIIALNLIVTPEFIRRLTDAFDGKVSIYAYRLDRGLSPEDVLAAEPGARWAEESGLTENHYIVPGAGGMGEVMNNALS